MYYQKVMEFLFCTYLTLSNRKTQLLALPVPFVVIWFCIIFISTHSWSFSVTCIITYIKWLEKREELQNTGKWDIYFFLRVCCFFVLTFLFRRLPLKQLWSWLVVVACNQVGQQRLMATGLLLRILQISVG